MYVSSVSLKAPPSPLRKVRVTRSVTVRWKAAVFETLALVAAITRSAGACGDVGLVAIRSVDEKPGVPFPGERVHSVLAGHPERVRFTRSWENPSTSTRAVAVAFRRISTDVGSTESVWIEA